MRSRQKRPHRHRDNSRKIRKNPREKWLCPYAAGLLRGGHLGILFSLCCLWIFWDSGMRGEALLYAETYLGATGGSLVSLWATALGIDWAERLSASK
jgi:hypothetical protein